LYLGRFCTGAPAVLACGLAIAAMPIELKENFQAGQIARSNGDVVFPSGLIWRRENNPNGIVEVQPDGTLRLTVQKGAYNKALNGEGDLYDRSEIREGKETYRPPGSEVWYRLSFRVPAGLPKEDTRLVVLQLKTPYPDYDDASPAVALRLEHGMLFATAEHVLTLEQRGAIVAADVAPGREARCPTGFSLAGVRDDPGPQMRVLLGTGPGGLPPRRKGEYTICTPFAKVERSGQLPLVDEGWHDIVLGVKTGEDGWLTLQADGVTIARASGAFGDSRSNGPQYLKFGPYRDKSDSTVSIEFARFRRAATAQDVSQD
jgi:hypothetical protein